MNPHYRRCWLLLLVVAWVITPMSSNWALGQYLPSDYIDAQEGSLPILVIASHGGRSLLPGVGLRACGDPGVECDADWNTDLLAAEFADELFLNLRQAPYVIVANARRTQVDLNRDVSVAYDDPNAAAYYDAFHDQISAYVAEIRSRWGEGLLIDLHGQSQEPSKVFRGTKNGLTFSHATTLVGPLLTLGESSLLGQLQQLSGMDVVPSVSLLPQDQMEDPRFDGGFIVQTYGSHVASGIDALQIEFGSDFRSTPQTTRQTAASLAEATANYYSLYQSALLVPESHAQTSCCGASLLLLGIGRRRLGSARARIV